MVLSSKYKKKGHIKHKCSVCGREFWAMPRYKACSSKCTMKLQGKKSKYKLGILSF